MAACDGNGSTVHVRVWPVTARVREFGRAAHVLGHVLEHLQRVVQLGDELLGAHRHRRVLFARELQLERQTSQPEVSRTHRIAIRCTVQVIACRNECEGCRRIFDFD